MTLVSWAFQNTLISKSNHILTSMWVYAHNLVLTSSQNQMSQFVDSIMLIPFEAQIRVRDVTEKLEINIGESTF